MKHVTSFTKENSAGTSLVVQWLRLRAPTAGGTGSIPGRGTKILHARGVAKKKEKKTVHNCNREWPLTPSDTRGSGGDCGPHSHTGKLPPR